jgi:hypothetical protein
MRTSIKQIIFCTCLAFCYNAFALDTSQQEKTCSEIGFKKKTEAHAKCVLEILSRQGGTSPTMSSSASSNPDDATCKGYGFKPGTNSYGECRQRLDFTRQQAAQKQQEYEEQKRQNDMQIAEQKRQRQAAAGLALMQMSSGLVTPPKPPSPTNQTIVTPGGRIVNCHTTGTVTNCF